MRMLLVVLSLFVGTVFAADLRFSGWTNPKTYLSEFPLNQVTQQELLSQLGLPKNTVSFSGAEYWAYPVVAGVDGASTFTFEIRDGKVIDVRYNNAMKTGMYDGLSAKESQKKD